MTAVFSNDSTLPRVKVLFVLPTLRGGGAERVMVMLANRLDPARFEASLAVVDIAGAVHRDKLRTDVEVIDLGCSRVRYALPKLVALIRARRPDVVLSTLGHLNLGMAAIRAFLPHGTKVIGRETTVVSSNIDSYTYPRLWAWLYRHVYPQLDHVICQSRDMYADLIETFAFPPERATIVHNPVDVAAIRRSVDQEPPQLNDGLPAGSCRLVAAGRLSPEKGFDLLIEAIALCDDPSLHLTVVGDGPDAEALRDLARARGVAAQVDFRGFIADPYPMFAAADALVLSSRFDGFPNVVLEALACGTPVIACPAPGGTREILGGIPECEIAPSVSAEGLAAAISRWRARQTGRVLPEAVSQYDVRDIVRQYEAVLAGVVNAERRPASPPPRGAPKREA